MAQEDVPLWEISPPNGNQSGINVFHMRNINILTVMIFKQEYHDTIYNTGPIIAKLKSICQCQ
jgi:hypothetical protein